ncbi:MAG: VanZ family protein [Myxococcota bacterium]
MERIDRREGWIGAAAAIGAALAVGSTAIAPWIAAGPPIVDQRMEPPRRVAPPEAAVVVPRPPLAGDAAGWLITAEVTVESEGATRLYLASRCPPPTVAPPAPSTSTSLIVRREPRRPSDANFSAVAAWFAVPLGPPGARSVELAVPEALTDCTADVGVRARDGVATVSRVTIAPARRSPLWLGAVGGSLAVSGVAGWAAGRRLWASLGPTARQVAVGVGLAVLIGVSIPGPTLDQVLLAFPGARPEDLGVDPWVHPTVPGLVQKLGGHGLAFGVLGGIGASAGAPFARVVARCAGFAIATEALQRLIPSRSGRWEDAVLDTVAAAIGAALVLAAIRASDALRARRGSGASPT